MYAFAYVDDILIIDPSFKLGHDIINKIHLKFALKKLGRLEYFLDIKVWYHA